MTLVRSMFWTSAAAVTFLLAGCVGFKPQPLSSAQVVMDFDARSLARLFLGCDNKKMVMMDSTTGKVLATVPIGAGVDANAFDPGTQLAFSSNGEDGTTTIAKEVATDRLTVVQTLKTVVGARTMALDPLTHNIYLPAPTPAFRVLVYGVDKQ